MHRADARGSDHGGRCAAPAPVFTSTFPQVPGEALSVLALLLALQSAPAGAAVSVPRFEERVVIDGVLDEDVWSRAAVLDGFMQYEPADGRPAAQRTEVRVWYAPDAIHFAIIATDSEPQSIRATRADRDNISGEDYVTIYLDTFRDRRRAFFFAVNPLGVQQDGVRTEGASSAGRAFGGSTDRSPDFLWQSRGRVTETGWVAEVRIPFRSLRYPAGQDMQWGINIERKTQRTGFVDAWPETRRASASFLAQGGVLTGLHDLRRGVVFEAQPFVTVNAPATRLDGAFVRNDPDTEAGVNLRVGFTNLSLDATINPDFSQIEADAGQVTVNERFAIFVPEKRPFFLEGIELFATPNQLVYTRQIADPRAGGKVTGKFGALSVAHMTALDRAAGEGDAVFNVTRLRRDVGANSLLGLTYTDRTMTEASLYNRVLAADARVVFARLYYVEGQLGHSWSELGDGHRAAPIWKAEFDRTGRSWGFNHQLNAVGDDFITQAGFVNRRGITSGRAMNRLTWYGPEGGAIERANVFFGPNRVWRYDGFGRERAIEGSEFANLQVRLRGDWSITTRVAREFVHLDEAEYATYATTTPAGPAAYVPVERIGGASVEFGVSTPIYQRFDAGFELERGRVAIFAEGAPGNGWEARANLSLRPTPSVRTALTGTVQHIARSRDGSEFARTVIPRLRAEFQPTRAFFLRGIAEYRSERRSDLRNAHTGAPLLIGGEPVPARAGNSLRFDLLASYQPVPGTVAFLGYGASLQEPDAFAFRDLERTADGFFLKLAYQLRR